MEKLYLFMLLTFLAEIIGTVSGFGSSILFVPIASMFFDFKEVLGITAVYHIFSNISKIALFRKGINKKIVWKLGLPAVVFVIIGATLTLYFDTKKLELFMNIALILLAVSMLLFFRRNIAQNNSNLYIGGAVSGLFAGLIGTGGAIRGITLAAFQLPKQVFVATSAVIDFGVDLSRAIVYISNHYFLMSRLTLIPFLILISWIGSYVGKLILGRISDAFFRYLVLVLVVISAAFQIYQYFTKG
jgi:uncharacterized protein